MARTPLVHAVALALLLQALGVDLPRWAANTTSLLGDCAVPLMLLSLGVALARLRLQLSLGRALPDGAGGGGGHGAGLDPARLRHPAAAAVAGDGDPALSAIARTALGSRAWTAVKAIVSVHQCGSAQWARKRSISWSSSVARGHEPRAQLGDRVDPVGGPGRAAIVDGGLGRAGDLLEA